MNGVFFKNTILIQARASQSYSQTALICTHFDQLGYFHMEAKSFPLCPPPYSPRNFENWACMPLYIGWCFLDLKWTFYRARLPMYIKNDSGVFAIVYTMTSGSMHGHLYTDRSYTLTPIYGADSLHQLWGMYSLQQ